MKKILYMLLFAVLFAACSDDDSDSRGGNGNRYGVKTDPLLVGNWKVEYSKTIMPAYWRDGVLDYDTNAAITEYLGNWGTAPNIPIESSMFGNKEFKIEIQTSNTIIIHQVGNPITRSFYSIKDGFITHIVNREPINVYRYYFEEEQLVIEVMLTGRLGGRYTISRYSKIEE
ncbi:hypothetical protein D0T53_10210 [Dysgonomonas sp. 216]|uniref:hypothetical protein n=1 Tax=Dysgonomonas sp. 216 TaxID=2302934 RepID=UPI0013D67A4B|nr:hypothetical protein [Dysgonomonas sp. 216]NDW19285.1 hypothetical protein [Dysgonomonas sp. 216]